MRIILARHGDAKGADGKFHGLENNPLTSEGRAAVYKTAKELEQYNPTMIFSDKVARTKESAKILSDELNIPVRYTDALKPLDLGYFAGKKINDYVDKIKFYLAHPKEKIPDGQSVEDWAEQYLPFFEKYFNHKSKESIILMTHGRNILLTKGYIDKGNLAPDFDKNALLNSKISTEHGGYAIAEPPDHFEIVTPKPVKVGTS